MIKNHKYHKYIKSFKDNWYISLKAISEDYPQVRDFPNSIKLLLESTIRYCDNNKIKEEHINTLINWEPNNIQRNKEIPFIPGRILLQDYTGIPLITDLAAMRDAIRVHKIDPQIVEPQIPVDLVIDHSLHTNFTNRKGAADLNLAIEFRRNKERYEFMKWSGAAFDNINIIPPGNGIVHQINLEYLSKGIVSQSGFYYPDTVIGTDSHTTMVNGLGILGWGVGGIEAELAMLGQPMFFLEPDVIGVNLSGEINKSVTTTDVVLTITQILREKNVVGKFIEYHGEGVNRLSVPDRATIANMAPEYGATIGLFPIDDNTLTYYKNTARPIDDIDDIKEYFLAQGLFNRDYTNTEYTKVIDIDLSDIEPCIAGPKRPQDRIILSEVKGTFDEIIKRPMDKGGYGKSEINEKDGKIVIAGITSCTNTSNPSVLIAAGLLAKKAVDLGVEISKSIKTSLAPGSKAVIRYLENLGLQTYLDTLGFYNAGYGCATCVGNVGEINVHLEKEILNKDIIACSVLSGNRNFEARIHPNLRANFLMSPPLVIAYAIAGKININLETEPLAISKHNKPIYLKDLWPTQEEINEMLETAENPAIYQDIYSSKVNKLWDSVEVKSNLLYDWDEESTFISKPPFLENFSIDPQLTIDIHSARCLAILGDYITTDHISPVGTIGQASPAGWYLKESGVKQHNSNTYGARRGNSHIMTRGAFSNPRLKNKILNNKEGGYTIHYPSKDEMTIYEASTLYKKEKVPTVIIAGEGYGAGSSRDWAAKGTYLLGIRAVIAQSYERIHRTNLIGMRVLPLQFLDGNSAESLNIKGDEEYTVLGLENISINKLVTLIVTKSNNFIKIPLKVRIDTDTELEYYKSGGILHYILRNIILKNSLAKVESGDLGLPLR